MRAALDNAAHGLHRVAVMGEAPSRRQIRAERFGLHDQADQAMLAAARLAIDLALPTEEATSGIAQVFPSMRTDIVIERRNQTLRAGTIYQLYALSQEGVIDRLVAVEAEEGMAEHLKQQLMGPEAAEADPLDAGQGSLEDRVDHQVIAVGRQRITPAQFRRHPAFIARDPVHLHREGGVEIEEKGAQPPVR